MTTTTPAPTSPRTRIALVLIDMGDPLERQLGFERTTDNRLKQLLKALLRSYGFRCERVGPTDPPT